MLIENNSLVEKLPSQKENVDSECDFPHKYFQILYIEAKLESDARLPTRNNKELNKFFGDFYE